jgi:hypothetical protein
MFSLREGSYDSGSPTQRQKTAVYRVLQQKRYPRRKYMNKKVYVANLPSQATEPELNALFSKAGSVMSVKIVKDRQIGQPRGIAFVEMSTQWEAGELFPC